MAISCSYTLFFIHISFICHFFIFLYAIYIFASVWMIALVLCKMQRHAIWSRRHQGNEQQVRMMTPWSKSCGDVEM